MVSLEPKREKYERGSEKFRAKYLRDLESYTGKFVVFPGEEPGEDVSLVHEASPRRACSHVVYGVVKVLKIFAARFNGLTIRRLKPKREGR